MEKIKVSEHAYTLTEIDHMRYLIGAIDRNLHSMILLPGMHHFTHTSHEVELENERRIVEDKLRSYMIGNLDPQDLEIAYEESLEVYNRRRCAEEEFHRKSQERTELDKKDK